MKPGGPEHKRAALCDWGWFLGVEWPFVLVGTKVENWKDCKVLNISRKKIRVYEGQYAFLPTSTEYLPLVQNLEIDSDGYYKEVM